ncbi:hypothetical protein [Sporosarcina sp. FA9]|uniref:hypothetical protein n=1 Tax=Sporosarcina sp. FA9 TaxID=3413030 RepID=UPI003F65ED49
MKSKLVILMTTFFLTIILFIFYFFYGTPWELVNQKEEFKVYLEDKYNQEFTIKKMNRSFFQKTYHASAYSKNNPEMHFNVGQISYTNEIYDGYDYGIWEKKASSAFEPILIELFPDRHNYAVTINDFTTVGLSSAEVIHDFKEAVIIGIGISMANTIVTEENIDFELGRAFKLVEFIKNEKIPVASLNISYDNKVLRIEQSEMRNIEEAEDVGPYIHYYK